MLNEQESETSFVDAWKIGVFTEKVNEALLQLNLKKVHRNTLDNWFKRMESINIHYLKRAGKEKLYFESDKEIAIFIATKKEEGWELDGIFNKLSSHFTLNPKSETPEEEAQKESQNHELREQLKNELMKEIETSNKEFYLKQIETMNKIANQNREEMRLNRKNDMLADSKIRKELRKEALDAWNSLDEQERTISETSFFGLSKKKREDTSKMYHFISEYIENNYEKAITEEFQIYDGSIALGHQEVAAVEKIPTIVKQKH